MYDLISAQAKGFGSCSWVFFFLEFGSRAVSFQYAVKDLGVALGSFCLEFGSSTVSFQHKLKDLGVVLGSCCLEISSNVVSFQHTVKDLGVSWVFLL